MQFQATARERGGFALGNSETTQAMLSGSLSVAQVHERLVPAITTLVQHLIDANPQGSDAQALLHTFDTNHDGKVSNTEVEEQPIVAGLLQPDVDLFDEHGQLAPNQNKVKDALSFSIGFTALPALFTPQDPR